jgi:uncharacterized protein
MPLPAPSDTATAVVTGASSGMGDQFARQLSGRGYHVTIVARRRDRLEALQRDLGGEDRAHVVAADLATEEGRDELGDAVRENGRDVEILVNNAGFGVYEPFRRSDRAQELQQAHLLVDAVVDLTHRWWGGMCAAGRGAVINVSSTSAFQPLPYNAGYAAAKAHTLFLSEALHAEGKEEGVTVTAVCPGPVATGFQDASDATFADKLPKATWVEAERIVAEAIAAAEAGKRAIVPGGAFVKASFAPNRYLPTGLTNLVSKRLMKR